MLVVTSNMPDVCVHLSARAKLVRSIRAVFAVLVAVFLIAPTAAADDFRPGSGDEFIVVDCLLPSQVRRLGGRTYIARRKPVLATAEECHVRGGEYVLEDRASLSGSLEAWLPAAMGGDSEAQNYVGELAERGARRRA